MPKIIVIAHLASEECISSLSNSIWQQETTSSTTKSHATYLAATKCIVTNALYAEERLQTQQELSLILSNRQFSYHASSCRYGSSLGLKEREILQTYLIGNTIVDTTLRIIKVSVSCIDGNTSLYGLNHTALNITFSRNGLQSMKQERMVRNNHVAPLALSLINDSLSHVQTQ